MKESGLNFATDAAPEYEQQTFKKIELSGQKIKQKIFQECIFIQCTLTEVSFDNCKFFKCTFKECDLNLLKVKNCIFSEVDFENSRVVGVNWMEAMWGKHNLLGSINFTGCTINYSTFIGLTLRKMKLSRCIAKDVDFAEADLTQAICSGTDFTDSRFNHTNLTEADFTDATHYNISATDNTLKKTRFSLPEAVSLLHSLDIILNEQG
ncbi:MAG: pentapeptide repeat-containing protein [Anaerolineaceae bacterium]|nr:pentapeptide repeat-containing protein [Anaerolineaceae bacterium]